MSIVNGIKKEFRDMTDDEIYKLADEKWKSLPLDKRTSSESICICEDMFIIRELQRRASNG